eukprot:749767-Hanusia_phi.AAC.3
MSTLVKSSAPHQCFLRRYLVVPDHEALTPRKLHISLLRSLLCSSSEESDTHCTTVDTHWMLQ